MLSCYAKVNQNIEAVKIYYYIDGTCTAVQLQETRFKMLKEAHLLMSVDDATKNVSLGLPRLVYQLEGRETRGLGAGAEEGE